MLITRLYLRNFRVFEDELDLEVPPGLVGIFGPNGAGKSTLLESITWTLWGKARTPKEQIRSSGVSAECVTEVSFEHEGHLYLVRRSLTGLNATVKAEAHCDGLIMSEGVRDTARYLHSVLGVDDAAFRASVFAEQKQLAAFSDQTPAERRRLVLQLLGITPLDGARDAVRRDAKAASEHHVQLRRMLPDLDHLRVVVADADARAGAAEATAAEQETAAAAAASRASAATDRFAELDRVRQAYDSLVTEGRAARTELDNATAAANRLRDELAALSAAGTELAAFQQAAAGLPDTERRLPLLERVVDAATAALSVAVGPEPAQPDEAAHDARATAAEEARAALAGADAALRAATDDLGRARQQAERSAGLSAEGHCPLCGQELGAAFADVQAHRQAEVAEAEARRSAAEAARQDAATAAQAALADLEASKTALAAARRTHDRWRQAEVRHRDAVAEAERARAALAAEDPELAAGAGEPAAGSAARDALRRRRDEQRAAADDAQRLAGRLERRPQVEAHLAEQLGVLEAAQANVNALLDKVRSLGFDRHALAGAADDRDAAVRAAQAADGEARRLRLVATQERTRAEGEAQRLADGEAQHRQLAELADDATHLTRLAELLNAFRNTVVASVGPRLATQAAELFAELTDHEYDLLEVDPETYELKITDGGVSYGLDRFSGSEVDLANLALRVAISEHVRFQSGGSVGLLVLDEVFGPLDEERKARMLLALDQLRGRFRQILVVTHATDIKEQLPNAIEVVKRPGRRAGARVLNA